MAAASTASLVTQCTVGPDFSPPPDPQTTSYTRDDAQQTALRDQAEEGQSIVIGQKLAPDWWRLFEWAPLDQLIREAVDKNQSLAAAQATLGQAQQAVRQASGANYPQVSFSAGASRQRASLAAQGIPTPPTEFNLYSIGPSVSFALDPFGGTPRHVEQEEALSQAQRYQLAAAYLTLTGNVANEVVNIAEAQDQIDAVNEIIADDERNLELVRTETKAGELTRIDLETAGSQLASDRTLLPPLLQQLDLGRDALSLLLAKAPSDGTPPSLSLNDIHLPIELPLSLPSELVHQRPDVLSAEAQLHSASAAVGVATAQLYPNIVLSASTLQQSLKPNMLFNPMANVWSLAANLTAPIFEGGALEAQRRATEYGLEASLATYEQTVLQSFSQVADVLHALAHDAALVREQRLALQSAQSALGLTRTTLSYGNVSLLQLLDAQRQFSQARLGLVRAEGQRYRDTIQLFVAMGGGSREWAETGSGTAQEKHAPESRPATVAVHRTTAAAWP